MLTSWSLDGGLTFLHQNYEVAFVCYISTAYTAGITCENALQLYTDSYYTSPQLVYALAKLGVWCCGSLKTTGRSHLPKDIVSGAAVDKNQRQRGSILRRHCNTGIMSCINWMDKRALLILSSLKHIGDEFYPIIRKDRLPNAKVNYITINRPAVVAEYTKYMRGVDVA